MLIEVYSDLVCPSCYIGERRLEKALSLRPDLEIERRWRAFRPEMSAEGLHWRDFAIETLGGEERFVRRLPRCSPPAPPTASASGLTASRVPRTTWRPTA